MAVVLFLKYSEVENNVKLLFYPPPPHTVLRFVGPTDHIYSCSFVQMLERRLENAFDEAQDKVLETYSKLTVEVQYGL